MKRIKKLTGNYYGLLLRAPLCVAKQSLLLAMTLFLLCSLSHAFSLNVDPPSVGIKLASSESKTGIINLSNKGDETISVNAYTEDWIYSKDRSKEFKKAGSVDRSCSNWISVFPNSFTIDPGETKNIRYTITAPLNSTGGYYSVIFFESQIQESEKTKNSNVIVAGRIGTIIYAETEKGTNRSASIEGLSVVHNPKSKSINVAFNFNNQGNILLSPKGFALITDKNSTLYGKFDINKFNAMPGETLPVKSSVSSALNEGEYNIIVTLDYEGSYPLTAEKQLIIK